MKRKLLTLLLCFTLLLSLTTVVSAANTTGGGPDDFLVDVSLPLLPARSSELYDDPEKPLPSVRDDSFVADIEGWTPMFVTSGLPVKVTEADSTATVITDRAGLEAMTAGNYVLGADIDLTDMGWTPLYIRGNLTLDGRGYTIKGLSMDMAGKDLNGGLFSQVDGNLTIKNLRMERWDLTMNSASYGYYGGLLVGKAEKALTLENIAGSHLYIKLSGTKVGSVGGLVGEASGETVLRNISAETCIYRDPDLVGTAMEAGYNAHQGGLVGFSYSGILVENCYAKTELNVEDTRQIAGGLVGGQQGRNVRYANCKIETSIHAFNTSGGLFGKTASSEPVIQVENCVVLGNLKGRQNLGGLVGNLSNRPLNITDSRFIGTLHQIAGGTTSSNQVPTAGGLVGLSAYTTITADRCAVDMTWSTDCADRAAPTFVGSVGGLVGYGSAGLDLTVTGCSVRLVVDDQAVDNIDIGGLCGRNFGSSGYANVRDTAVTCQVDLLHKNGSVAAGMIPKIGSANFVNCGANVDIRMEALQSARISVSGMCWDVDKKVTFAKCYAYGTIRATSGDNDVYATGLSDCGQATQCYSGVDITVDSKSSDVAGLILSADGTPIVSSWSNASLRVKTTGNSRVGGLAQFASGNITDSCFTGSITTNNATWLGGIASRSTGIVRNCYVDTDLANGKYIGGIVGSDYAPTITNIYDCRFTGSIRDAGEYAAGIMCYGNGGTVSGCEVEADIDCPDCFVGGIMAGNYSSTVIRDCTVDGSVAGRLVGGIAGNCNSLSIYDCTVTATVDLAVSSDNTDARGAGGIAYAALVIDDCHMKAPMNIDHQGRDICVGGICAVAPAGYRCEVTNCTSKGVTCFADGGSCIGGIAGGGAGDAQYLELYNCRVDGNVRLYVDGSNATVGGIVGRTGCSVYDCVVNGNVSVYADIPQGTQGSGSIFAGGIAGDMFSNGNEDDYVVSRCYHMGSVTATYSGEPEPFVHTNHPLVGEGGKIRNCDFSYDRENNEETYIIRTWWHEEYDTVMQPLGYAEIYLNDVFVGSTNESGSLTLAGKDLSDNDRLVISAEKAGYRGAEKEAWFADGGVIDLYLMKKTPGKIYLKAARIYDSEDKATELLYTNNSVTILQQDNTARKMYFEVDWNDLSEEGRVFCLENEDASRSVSLQSGSNMYLNLNTYFKPGDQIWLKAQAYDSKSQLQEAKDQLGLKIQAVTPPVLYIKTEDVPLGDNNGIRGIDFLNGLDLGIKGSLNGGILDTSYVNNVFKLKFGLNTMKTPKLTFLSTQARLTIFGEIQAAAASMEASMKDAKWSGKFGAEVALDPALDFGMSAPPLAFNTEIKASAGGDFTIEGSFNDPVITGSFTGAADFGIVVGPGLAAGDMCIIAGPEIGAAGEYTMPAFSSDDDAILEPDAKIEGDVSVSIVLKGGEFFELHPSYQLGRFVWTNKDGWKAYAFGVEIPKAKEAALLKWTPSDRTYLSEGGGFCMGEVQLLDWTGSDAEQDDFKLLYENIMLSAQSVLTIENGIPVLYFTADDGDGSQDGSVAENTVLWRTEQVSGIWRQPEQISETDKYVDSLDADGPAVIWVESDETDELSAMLTSADVMVRINGVTTQLTQGEGYVYDAKISSSANGTSALAIWFSQPEATDAEGLFRTDGRKLMYATFNGTVWSEPRSVEVKNTIVSATPSISQKDIFWTDENGTMSAYYYPSVQYSETVLDEIGISAHADDYTAAMKTDGLSIWKNKSLQTVLNVAPIELEMICNPEKSVYCVVWSQIDGIYYADSDSGWVCKPLIQTDSQPYDLSATMVDGLPQVSFFLTDYNTDRSGLVKHLYTALAPDLSGLDAAVTAAQLDDSDLARSGVLRMTATVTNLGEQQLTGYTYTVTDESDLLVASGSVSDLALTYGKSTSCLAIFAADTSIQHTYTLTITAENDENPANNAITVGTVSAAEVVQTSFPLMHSGETGLEAIVTNRGAAPVEQMTVEIYRCTSDGVLQGDALVSETFEQVPAGSYRQIMLDKTKGNQFYKVVVLSDGEEVDSDMLCWKDESAACLWVNNLSVSNKGAAELSLYAHNWEQDLSLMLALYQDGKMVACGMKSDLDAWEGTNQVELALDSLSPGKYTCAVYLLNRDTFAPVTEVYSRNLTIG